MSTIIDDYWLLAALSIVSGSLFLVIEVTGLVLALRRWRSAGVSARLAAAGFGLSIVTMIGSYAGPPLSESLVSTYSGQDESPFLPILIFQAISTIGSLISTVLIVAALLMAWRRAERSP